MTGRERAEMYGDCTMGEAEEEAFFKSMVEHRLRLKQATGRYSSVEQPPLPSSTPEEDEADAQRRHNRANREEDEHPEPWTL